MKKLIKYMMLFLCILLMTGCSNKKSVGGKNITTANSVDKIINEQTKQRTIRIFCPVTIQVRERKML